MSIIKRNDIFTNIGKGKNYLFPIKLAATGTTTVATAASGDFTAKIYMNSLGTTYPSTLVGFPIPSSLSNELFNVSGFLASASTSYVYLAYFYKIGTLSMTVTGNDFTHDAATFPLLRTQFGAASKPVTLLPMMYMTTASSVTAPSFTLKTVAGGAGYTNQDGTNVIGTRTLTLPNVATAVQSGFIFRLEDGDSGIQDIIAIDDTIATTTGSADIYGVELICPFLNTSQIGGYTDSVFGSLSMNNLAPAVATSGTVTAYLGILQINTANNTISEGFISASLNA